MIKRSIAGNSFALKWLSIAFVIKLVLFIFFAINFKQNWPAEWVTNGLFINTGDTPGYYVPLESFANGHGYDSYCRMPGLLPFYAPLRLFFDEGAAKAGIVVFQFFLGVISVYLLAQIAQFVLKSPRAFYWTFFIYAFSSFVSIWDHYGMSESFGTSLLIFSIYFLTRYKTRPSGWYIFFCGLFLTWSVFFRAIHGILIPVVILFFLFDRKQLALTFKHTLQFLCPVVLFLGIWTYKNYTQYGKPVVLTGSVFDCTGFLSREHIAIRELIIAWGGDYQPWSKGSEAEWFFQSTVSDKAAAPNKRDVYTSAYNLDSLLTLRSLYEKGKSDTLSADLKENYNKLVLSKSRSYVDSYVKEHAFNYYVVNKLLILKKILIPSRLDDLPLPALSSMNLFQKLTKIFYFLLLIFIGIAGIAGGIIALIRGNRWAMIPLILITLIGIVFGFVEQRYLAPSYPFFVIFTIYLLFLAIDRIRSGRTPTDK